MKTIEKYAPRELSEVVFAKENSRALIDAVAR